MGLTQNERAALKATNQIDEYKDFINAGWNAVRKNPNYKTGTDIIDLYYRMYNSHNTLVSIGKNTGTELINKDDNTLYSCIIEATLTKRMGYLNKHHNSNYSQREAFEIVKAGYLDGRLRHEYIKAESAYSSVSSPIDMLLGKGSVFADIEKLLLSGDRTFRGSSAAYKEIQREVKDLKNKLNEWGDSIDKDFEKQRYTQLLVNSLIERARDYILDRQKFELDGSKDSYKGHRVNVMRKALVRLSIARDKMKDPDFFFLSAPNHVMSKKYKKAICEKVSTTTFNRTLFGEYLGLKTAKTLDETQKEQASYTEDEHTKLMKTALKGKILGSKTLYNMWNKVKHIFEAAKNNIEGAKENDDYHSLTTAAKETKDKIKAMSETEEFDRLYSKNPTDYSCKAIGDYDLDLLVLKKIDSMYTETIKNLPQNNMSINM